MSERDGGRDAVKRMERKLRDDGVKPERARAVAQKAANDFDRANPGKK